MTENTLTVCSGTIQIVAGSVLDQPVDVIVNAANTAMRGGGGVDGAIHLAAGKGLVKELQELVSCPARTAEPVLTGAHNLPHKAILHVAGPIWHGGGSNEKFLLASCYKNCLKIAAEQGHSSIAFCGISTGIYRFPLSIACKIALTEAKAFLEQGQSSVQLIVFAMFGSQEYQTYVKELESLS